MPRILKIVSNLSDLFEDPDSFRDTGHALVLLLNTYKRFQDGNIQQTVVKCGLRGDIGVVPIL